MSGATRGMRPSGVEVIGDIPAHWNVKPLRQLGRILKGIGGSKEDIIEEGVPCVRYGDLYTTHAEVIEAPRTYLTVERAAAYTPIHHGDLLFAASGETLEEIGKSAINLIRGDARCGGDVIILRPTVPITPRFHGYAADSSPSVAQKTTMGRGTTVKHIYPGELRSLTIAIPPLNEQSRIAEFLDRKTAAIDALIAKKEQLAALLAEKRQALITQAVTKGLEPKVPMKESGVEWIGEVPAHWTVKKLGLLLRGIEQGWSPECISRPPEPGAWGVLKAGAVNSGALDELESKALPDGLEPIPSLEVRPGDVLMSRASGSPLWVGSVGIVRETTRRLLLCDKLYRLGIDRHQLVPEYAVLVLRSPAVRQLIDAGATGQSTLRNIGQDFVRGIVLAWPPLDEQERILARLREELHRLDGIAHRVGTQADKLREYRQALITAAVTGKLDVSGEAAA